MSAKRTRQTSPRRGERPHSAQVRSSAGVSGSGTVLGEGRLVRLAPGLADRSEVDGRGPLDLLAGRGDVVRERAHLPGPGAPVCTGVCTDAPRRAPKSLSGSRYGRRGKPPGPAHPDEARPDQEIGKGSHNPVVPSSNPGGPIRKALLSVSFPCVSSPSRDGSGPAVDADLATSM
jgi:hypothetical protein